MGSVGTEDHSLAADVREARSVIAGNETDPGPLAWGQLRVTIAMRSARRAQDGGVRFRETTQAADTSEMGTERTIATYRP